MYHQGLARLTKRAWIIWIGNKWVLWHVMAPDWESSTGDDSDGFDHFRQGWSRVDPRQYSGLRADRHRHNQNHALNRPLRDSSVPYVLHPNSLLPHPAPSSSNRRKRQDSSTSPCSHRSALQPSWFTRSCQGVMLWTPADKSQCDAWTEYLVFRLPTALQGKPEWQCILPRVQPYCFVHLSRVSSGTPIKNISPSPNKRPTFPWVSMVCMAFKKSAASAGLVSFLGFAPDGGGKAHLAVRSTCVEGRTHLCQSKPCKTQNWLEQNSELTRLSAK